MKHWRVLFTAMALAALTLATAASAAEPVKVGAMYPLSGSAAATGAELRDAVELAMEVVNGEYDLDLPMARTKGLPNLDGRPIQFIFADHQGNPEKAMTEAERLIVKEKVVVLQGAHHSSCVATGSQVAERLKIPYVTCQASSPNLHLRGLKWYFRLSPHDAIFAENFFQMIKEMQEKLGKKIEKMGVVWENSLYGRDCATIDKKLAAEQGYKMVADVPYTDKAAELTSEVQKVKLAKPEILFHASYVSDAILFIRTYQEMNVNVDMLFGHGSGFLNSAFVSELGKEADYISVWETWSVELADKKPLIGQVNELYRKKYGRNLNSLTAAAFTTALTVADAINRAGSTDPEKIREALRATDTPSSQTIMPWEKIAFDPETGQNNYATGIICQILDGKYRVVWPGSLASTEPVWPMPKWNDR